MADQICKDCDGDGEGPLFESFGYESYITNCPTCNGAGRINRTGPYRLVDGTWSDRVDRTYMIPSHQFSKTNPDRVYVHTTYDRETLGKWQPLFDVWQGDAMLECELSFDEAIAYADRMARTNQGENND